jgi:hypothetical protein
MLSSFRRRTRRYCLIFPITFRAQLTLPHLPTPLQLPTPCAAMWGRLPINLTFRNNFAPLCCCALLCAVKSATIIFTTHLPKQFFYCFVIIISGIPSPAGCFTFVPFWFICIPEASISAISLSSNLSLKVTVIDIE